MIMITHKFEATWRSGDASDCKSAHPGSIPGVASKFTSAKFLFLPKSLEKQAI